MPQSHTHQDSEQLARPTAGDVPTHSTEGQRLDEARETFRAEWQAKVDRKRRQSEFAARAAFIFHQASVIILAGSALLGGLYGCLAGFQQGALSAALLMSIGASLLGVLYAFVPASAAFTCAWLLCKRAERLERDARELERS